MRVAWSGGVVAVGAQIALVLRSPLGQGQGLNSASHRGSIGPVGGESEPECADEPAVSRHDRSVVKR